MRKLVRDIRGRKIRKIVATMLVSVMLIPTSAFASSGKTVEVNKFTYEDDTNVQSPQFSVTNVIEEIDENAISELDEAFDAGFIVSSSTDITIVDEGSAVFSGFKLTTSSEGYDFNENEPLPISGQSNAPGSKITLTEPGEYLILFAYEADGDILGTYVKVVDSNSQGQQTTSNQGLAAKPTSSKVLVNGKETAFDAYEINGNNYFKLRDIAKVVNGSKKQFEVIWDNEKNAINLVSNKGYTEVGGELSKGDGSVKTPVLNTSKIYKDSQEVNLTAYTIDGNNYFKLRDLAGAFNIGVTYSATTNTVGIDTNIEYVEE